MALTEDLKIYASMYKLLMALMDARNDFDKPYKVRRRICTEYILPVWGEYLYFAEEFSKCVIKAKYNKLYVVRKKLKNSKYARKFIRPKYIPD